MIQGFFRGESMHTDTDYMKKALELAEKARGQTSPNPLVGAVIVKDGRIIGEGYHHKAGEAHAEVLAIRSAKESVEGATIYVTLEPCSHVGRTPPCADLLVKEQFKRVVIAAKDPNPLVAGRGIKRLEEAGIEVTTGVLEAESLKLNEVFNHYITTGRPYVVMKYAMTLDGKIATESGESQWISSESSRIHAHKLRGTLSAIMVGINTVLADDPRLTCRLEGCSSPTRLILDSRLQIPFNAAVLREQDTAKTLIFTTEKADSNKRQHLQSMGIEVIVTAERDGQVDLQEVLQLSGARGLDSILLEGGGTLNASALKAEAVNKLHIYLAPKLLGGDKALSPVRGVGIQHMHEAYGISYMEVSRIEEDIFIEAYIK